jgi:predicted nucleic acid-binding protein
MVPSIVMAEYLADFAPEKQKAQQAIIGRNFFVAPFDAKAATIAGELHSKRLMKELRARSDIPRQCLKADVQIIATAIAHGAVRIYTDDGNFRKLAQGRIIVEDIPLVRPIPRDLFTDEDSGT